MTKRKTSTKKKTKSSKKKTKSPAIVQAGNQQVESVLIDLVVKRSSGVDDVYLLDAVDLGELGGTVFVPGKFIEIPTTKTPGIRFITLRRHNG